MSERVDNYNQDIESYPASSSPRVNKRNRSYLPIRGERLDIYLSRLGEAIRHIQSIATESHINGPKGAWYCHKSPGDCFICMQGQFLDSVYDSLVQWPYPERWFFETNKNGHTSLMERKKVTK